MADRTEEEIEQLIVVYKDVKTSLEEIMQAARKLRPDDEFSYSDVIRLLLELVQEEGQGGYAIPELGIELAGQS